MGKQAKQEDSRRSIHLRMDAKIVAWVDQEAKRQRRSRAYVMSEACRVLRALFEELESERRV